MNRLTKKNEYGGYQPIEQWKTLFDCLNKLGEIEDFEKEIGIDLATLFKALRCGIYTYFNSMYQMYELKLSTHFGLIHQDDKYYFCPRQGENWLERIVALEDYGKTWALTEEELK